MKTLNKSLIAATIVGAVSAGTLATAAIAGAESGEAANNPSSSLVDKIASTFNLDKSKVQKVFDEQRTEMEAKRATAIKERLQKLVDEGTITSAQKTAIESKLAEMKKNREANREEFKNLSADERKAKMDERKTALEAWAKEQGLDLEKLRGVLGGPGGPGGHGGPRP